MHFTLLPQYNPYKIAANCIVLVILMWGGDDRVLLNAFASVLSRSVVSDSATSWTVACQASLSLGFFPARILELVAISSSRAFALTNGRGIEILSLLSPF